eukprot:TRINITY_DN5111_c0_g1_i12.p1 TRINITY_DN5111_c0_g1~~TRINITY_DN5111_c0_g1_i12.p1  ORF type:complete len:172 (-),score=39.36 TRINITY_DN5111_c0_g1_i12:67-519(-)
MCIRDRLVNGVPFIDVNDWEKNTIYKGVYNHQHHVVRWFWLILNKWDQAKLAKFLQYCTGSSRTPVEGFRALESNRGDMAKFCIESVKYLEADSYPRAHTCFNRLDLPCYPTQEALENALNYILTLNFDGVFGIKAVSYTHLTLPTIYSV